MAILGIWAAKEQKQLCGKNVENLLTSRKQYNSVFLPNFSQHMLVFEWEAVTQIHADSHSIELDQSQEGHVHQQVSALVVRSMFASVAQRWRLHVWFGTAWSSQRALTCERRLLCDAAAVIFTGNLPRTIILYCCTCLCNFFFFCKWQLLFAVLTS